MNPVDVFKQVKRQSLPFIKSYRNDLLKHDAREIIKDHPNRRFLHFTGSMGTHIVTLLDKEDFPERGERVPYLFGHADRDHILNQIPATVKCMRTSDRHDLVLYYDGRHVYKINQDRAEEVASDYYRNMAYALTIR